MICITFGSENSIKISGGHLFTNTRTYLLMHFFLCFLPSPQALINLWQRGNIWCWQPSPKSSQDRMNALLLMTYQALMSGQCKSPSTVRAKTITFMVETYIWGGGVIRLMIETYGGHSVSIWSTACSSLYQFTFKEKRVWSSPKHQAVWLCLPRHCKTYLTLFYRSSFHF